MAFGYVCSRESLLPLCPRGCAQCSTDRKWPTHAFLEGSNWWAKCRDSATGGKNNPLSPKCGSTAELRARKGRLVQSGEEDHRLQLPLPTSHCFAVHGGGAARDPIHESLQLEKLQLPLTNLRRPFPRPLRSAIRSDNCRGRHKHAENECRPKLFSNLIRKTWTDITLFRGTRSKTGPCRAG
jgi:hypothetical protein